MEKEVVVQLIASVSGIIITILSAILGYYFKNNSKKDKIEIEKIPLLINHRIHCDVVEYIRIVRTMELGSTDGRDLLAADFLTSKFTAWREAAMEFASKVDNYIKISKPEDDIGAIIYGFAMEMFRDGMKYEDRLVTLDMDFDDRETVKIFRDKFRIWHEHRVDRFKKKLEDIAYDYAIYSSYIQKASRILELLDDSLWDTIYDAKVTMVDLNGSLSGKTYRGKVC